MPNTKILLLDLLSKYNSIERSTESGDRTPQLLKLVEDFDERIRVAIASEQGIDGLSGEQTNLLNSQKNEPTIH